MLADEIDLVNGSVFAQLRGWLAATTAEQRHPAGRTADAFQAFLSIYLVHVMLLDIDTAKSAYQCSSIVI